MVTSFFGAVSGDSNPGRCRLRQRSFQRIVKFCCAKLRVSGVLISSKNKRSSHPGGGGCFFGAPAGIRTPDTLLKRQVLCLLSYWGAGARTSHSAILTLWLGWRDSNPLYRSQSPVCYHYTTSQWLYERGLTACGRGPLSGGVGYGARTHDTRNHNPVLCQLS